jgi:pimeloyl-ACP methyl ester carboxylesterase
MIFVAPVLVALLSLSIQLAAIARGRGDLSATLWDSLARGGLTVWAVFLLPFLITLETSLLCGVEHGEKQWKHVFALPLQRPAIYWAKFLLVQALILLSTLFVVLSIALCGWMLMLWHPTLSAAGLPPLVLIGGRALHCWLAAGLIVSVNLWIALRWPSFTVSLGAGIAGTFFALFAASAEVSRYYPWLLPMNAISGGDRLAVALVLGIGGGLLVAVLGCIDFVRREESAPPQLSRGAGAAWALILVAFVAGGAYADRNSLAIRRSPHSVRFVQVDRNVQLEVIDWGGSGRPVVLLSGLGDTAHVFHQFAAKLTRDYHVYGITRRGFGASSVPASGYSADRLGDDVLTVLETLRLNRPVLVGHSIGGQELSSIGSRHPEKVAGLVYLDAAYSYAYYDAARGDFNIDFFSLRRKLDQLTPGNAVRDPRPLMAEVVASLPGFEKVLRARVRDLEAMPTPGGSGLQPATFIQGNPPGADAAKYIMAGQQMYSSIKAPILAIYALPHSTGSDNKQFEARDAASITGPQVKAFETAFPDARVVRLPYANHYIFQSHEADVLREMKSFIQTLPQH